MAQSKGRGCLLYVTPDQVDSVFLNGDVGSSARIFSGIRHRVGKVYVASRSNTGMAILGEVPVGRIYNRDPEEGGWIYRVAATDQPAVRYSNPIPFVDLAGSVSFLPSKRMSGNPVLYPRELAPGDVETIEIHRSLTEPSVKSRSLSPGQSLSASSNSYLARICWNTANWVYPTGDATKTEAKGTYASKHGFGHEEWLFNFQWILNGWKHGFLQPVNASHSNVEGTTISLDLFTIDPNRNRLYVGRISKCEVLSEQQATGALREFRARGWFDQMIDQIRNVGGDDSTFKSASALDVFNLRFREEDLELNDTPIVASPSDPVHRFSRYRLTPSRQPPVVDERWRGRAGTSSPKGTSPQHRKGIGSHVANLVEAQLQGELFLLLQKKYGEESVVMEENFVDIKLATDRSTRLIEIKSDPRARFAIRQALGQLLEYAYASSLRGEAVTELIVVAPGQLRANDSNYLEHLRQAHSLPLNYVCFRSGDSAVGI